MYDLLGVIFAFKKIIWAKKLNEPTNIANILQTIGPNDLCFFQNSIGYRCDLLKLFRISFENFKFWVKIYMSQYKLPISHYNVIQIS